jgi:hypothetical protein
MISWRLWQALKYPPGDHPLYAHTLASYTHVVNVPLYRVTGSEQPSDAFPFGEPSFGKPKRVVVVQPSNSSRNTVYKVLAVLGLGWFCCCSGGVFFALPGLLLLMAAGTLYGLYIAVRISGNIAEEHDQGRDELLSLTPSGAMGFSWAAVTGFLHRNTTFTRLHKWIPVICVGLTIAVAAIVVFIQISFIVNTPTYQGTAGSIAQGGYDRTSQQLTALIYVIGVGVAFYIDFFQSVAASILIAIITPTYGRNRFETQALTVGGFLGVQILTYLSTLLVGFMMLTGVFSALDLTGWLGEVLLMALRLGIFALVREALIVYLWQFAQQRLNIGAGEFESLARKPKREMPVT